MTNFPKIDVWGSEGPIDKISKALGAFYAPRAEPSEVNIDNDKAVEWLRKGAQPSEAVQKLLKISGAWDQFQGGAPSSSSPS